MAAAASASASWGFEAEQAVVQVEEGGEWGRCPAGCVRRLICTVSLHSLLVKPELPADQSPSTSSSSSCFSNSCNWFFIFSASTCTGVGGGKRRCSRHPSLLHRSEKRRLLLQLGQGACGACGVEHPRMIGGDAPSNLLGYQVLEPGEPTVDVLSGAGHPAGAEEIGTAGGVEAS